MTSVNMQITQTNQGNNDSSENIKRKEEFSIHIEATSEQASKDHTAQQYHAREGTGKPHVDTIHTGDTTATVSKTEKVPAITPPTSHPPVNSIGTANSSTKPALLHDQVSQPQAPVWISGPPKAALSVINSRDAHLPRNVHGDAAWPPVRPP